MKSLILTLAIFTSFPALAAQQKEAFVSCSFHRDSNSWSRIALDKNGEGVGKVSLKQAGMNCEGTGFIDSDEAAVQVKLTTKSGDIIKSDISSDIHGAVLYFGEENNFCSCLVDVREKN